MYAFRVDGQHSSMGLLPDTQNYGLRMRRESRKRFPRHRDLAIPTCVMARVVTHVPWCMTGSLTSYFLWSRWRGKRSWHSQRMRSSQFCVSGKRPTVCVACPMYCWGEKAVKYTEIKINNFMDWIYSLFIVHERVTQLASCASVDSINIPASSLRLAKKIQDTDGIDENDFRATFEIYTHTK